MTRLIACAALLAVLALGVRAEDEKKEKPKAAEALQELRKDYFEKINAETDKEKQQELIEEFGDKLVEHAKKNAKDESAVQALVMAASFTDPKGKPHEAAMKLLVKDHVKSKLDRGTLRQLAGQGLDPEALEFVKKVHKDNPDKLTRANAARALAGVYDGLPRIATIIEGNEKTRANVEKRFGKETIEKLLATAKKAPDLAKEYREALKKDFADVVPDLSIGAKAPATESVTLEGKKAKLSDLKGKVVVLDFWATWCGPCVRMIPHNREVAKKLADKPFVLVSVSADEKKETLEAFMKKQEMPWTHWWDGRGGKVAELWDVEAYPTLYVIDHKGVIRHKQRGFGDDSKELDEMIEKLVKAAEEDKTKN